MLGGRKFNDYNNKGQDRLLHEEVRVARTDKIWHPCDLCREPIEAGEKYRSMALIGSGMFMHKIFHYWC